MNICRVCGCSEANACIGDDGRPCHWVQADLCSCCETGVWRGRQLPLPKTASQPSLTQEACPFCESEIVAVGKLVDPTNPALPYAASCGSCGATGPEARSEADATTAWNRATLKAWDRL